MEANDFGVYIETVTVYIHDPAVQWFELMGVPVRDYEEGTSYPFVRFGEVGDLLSAPRKETTLFVFDELMLVPKEFYKVLTKLSVLRRHERVGIFAGSQRPANIPREFLSLSNNILVFALHDRDDVSKLKGLLNKEQLESIPTQKVGEFVEVRLV